MAFSFLGRPASNGLESSGGIFDKVRSQLLSSSSTEIDVRKFRQLEESNRRLEKEVEELEKARQSTYRLEIELTRKKAECESIVIEAERHRYQCNTLAEELGNVISENGILTKRNADLEQRLVDHHQLKEECGRLKEQVQALTLACNTAGGEKNRLQEQVQKLEASVGLMKEAAEQRRQLEAEYQKALRGLQEKQEEVQRLREEQQRAAVERRQAVSQLEGKVRDLERQHAEQTTSFGQLSRELTTLRREAVKSLTDRAVQTVENGQGQTPRAGAKGQDGHLPPAHSTSAPKLQTQPVLAAASHLPPPAHSTSAPKPQTQPILAAAAANNTALVTPPSSTNRLPPSSTNHISPSSTNRLPPSSTNRLPPSSTNRHPPSSTNRHPPTAATADLTAADSTWEFVDKEEADSLARKAAAAREAENSSSSSLSGFFQATKSVVRSLSESLDLDLSNLVDSGLSDKSKKNSKSSAIEVDDLDKVSERIRQLTKSDEESQAVASKTKEPELAKVSAQDRTEQKREQPVTASPSGSSGQRRANSSGAASSQSNSISKKDSSLSGNKRESVSDGISLNSHSSSSHRQEGSRAPSVTSSDSLGKKKSPLSDGSSINKKGLSHSVATSGKQLDSGSEAEEIADEIIGADTKQLQQQPVQQVQQVRRPPPPPSDAGSAMPGEDDRSGGHDPQLSVFIACYTYDPLQLSPNENPEAELHLTAGDYVYIHGDMDEDGFYEGELMDGRRGLVPSNFLKKVSAEELPEFLQTNSQNSPGDDEHVHQIESDLEFNSDEEDSFRNFLPYNALINGAYRGRSGTDLPISDLEDIPEVEEENSHSEAKHDGSLTSISEISNDFGYQGVPCPRKLRLERQLKNSVVVEWSPPEPSSSSSALVVLHYQVLVDGRRRLTLDGRAPTRAKIEDVAADAPLHRVSVKTVTGYGESDPEACTITFGREASPAPSHLRALNVAATCADLVWLPGNSNLAHTLSVNSVEIRTVRPGVHTYTLTGLLPATTYKVKVRAKRSKTAWNDSGNSSMAAAIELKTLPGGLPDPPFNVQVERSSRGGGDMGFLVTWLPVTLTPAGTSNGAVVTGYAVYVDNKQIAETDSPTADRIRVSAAKLRSFTNRHLVVRTLSPNGPSPESSLVQIPTEFLQQTKQYKDRSERMRYGGGGDMSESSSISLSSSSKSLSKSDRSAGRRDMEKQPEIRPSYLQEVSPLPSDSENSELSDIAEEPLEEEDLSAAQDYSRGGSRGEPSRQGRGGPSRGEGRRASTGRSKHEMEFDTDSELETLSRQTKMVPIHVIRQQDDYERETEPSPDHFVKEPVPVKAASIPHIAKGQRKEITRDSNSISEHQTNSRSQRSEGSRGRSSSGGSLTEPPEELYDDSVERMFVALYDYDPVTMSPNPDAGEEELSFTKGNLIKIFGDEDADGFYKGELHGVVGYVPGNMIKEVRDHGRVRNRTSEGSITSSVASVGGSSSITSNLNPLHSMTSNPAVRVCRMKAIFDYNPVEVSPNPDSDVELFFKAGDIITVYGQMDEDGFYLGELRGQQGLVPSNFMEEILPERSLQDVDSGQKKRAAAGGGGSSGSGGYEEGTVTPYWGGAEDQFEEGGATPPHWAASSGGGTLQPANKTKTADNHSVSSAMSDSLSVNSMVSAAESEAASASGGGTKKKKGFFSKGKALFKKLGGDSSKQRSSGKEKQQAKI